MTHCPQCNGENVQRRGTRKIISTGEVKHRFYCHKCQKQFSILLDEPLESVDTQGPIEPPSFSQLPQLKRKILKDKRVVVTSVKNGTSVNQNFFEILRTYATFHDCEILAIPVRHRNIGQEFNPDFDPIIEPYLFEQNIHFEDHGVKILGSLKISSTIENPLAGLDPISKGSSLIVGHPQIQLRTLPRIRETYPAIVTTTGSVSKKDYTPSKAGTKADFNHSLSAVVIEFDDGFAHIRHLNYDAVTQTVHDLDEVYTSYDMVKCDVEALVTGDEHVTHRDLVVEGVTYTNDDSMVNTLRPKHIVRHDVFDSYSVSHHHAKDFFARYGKSVEEKNYVERELEETIDFINETTPDYATSWIIQSNHNEHLTRWLLECDPSLEMWNAKIYHKLMYEVLVSIEEGGTRDAFQLYSRGKFSSNVKFADRDSDLYIKEILLSSHGDAGTNGSRGSRKQFSMIPTKSIIGHSHSPGIEKGCYQVGTSSKLKMEYNIGASSWHHAHCIIHKNGKRQLVFITNGKFKI